MFKVLVLQALYGISDEQAEFQIRDRLTFMRFLGLGLGDPVPDYSTIWRFREALVEAGAVDGLFTRFDAELKDRGYLALGGQLIDASIVEAPKQRLTSQGHGGALDGETRSQETDTRPGQDQPSVGAGGARLDDPGLRLQEPRQCRPAIPADPPLDGQRRRCP